MGKQIKKYLIFTLLLVCLILPVKAEDNNTNKSIIIGEDNVSFNQNVVGSAIIGGDNVTASGNVDGLLITGANNLSHNGITDYAIMGGNTVSVSGTYKKDVIMGGNVINVSSDSSFGRDVIVGGSNVTISGTINRNLTVYGSIVTLTDATIKGDVVIKAETINVKDTTTIEGNLTYTTGDNVQISSDATINSISPIEAANKATNYSNMMSKMFGYVTCLVVFATLALLIPRAFNQTAREEFKFMKILSLSGNGLLMLILIPLLAFILIALFIGIPLGIIVIGLYLLMLYLSNLFTGYYLGKNVWIKWIKKKDNILLQGLIGITIMFILYLIPIVGILTSIVSILVGLGLIYDTIKYMKRSV